MGHFEQLFADGVDTNAWRKPATVICPPEFGILLFTLPQLRPVFTTLTASTPVYEHS